MSKKCKSFCYYCNQLVNFKRQSAVQCNSCQTVCHCDCLSFECNPKVPVLKLKRAGQNKWKIINKFDQIRKVGSYTCNKCAIMSTPFNTLVTNSKGAIKKRFYKECEEDLENNYRNRNIADCLEPNYLNSLFYNSDPFHGEGKDCA